MVMVRFWFSISCLIMTTINKLLFTAVPVGHALEDVGYKKPKKTFVYNPFYLPFEGLMIRL
jgi:hypothetical protein